MILGIYIFLVLVILFCCHFYIKNAKIRKYKELINRETYSEFLETRSFRVIDKYEISNLKKFSPPTYIIKLQSIAKKETYEEELEVSMGTFLKTKIGEVKNYDIYNALGSTEVLLIDKNENKHFFFDEIKVLLFTEYILIASLGGIIFYFLIIQFLV